MADQPRNDLDASDVGVPDDVQALIVRYYDNDLDESGLAELRMALTQSADARELFVAWGVHGQLLTESLSANYMEENDEVMQGSPTVLAELAELEQQAQASLVSLHHFKKPWYTNKWAAGFGALAAVIALAVVLTFVFRNPGDTGNTGTNQIADGSTPGTVETPTADVATLTNTHNAVWSERALAHGSALHAGQKLTLTAGFAEITTNNGAIVVIEAPATIELIDNPNAIRLHAGKLVGLCYTELSKGFVVKTDRADIIDLGTEFGVHATHNKVTTTVFTGEVTLTTPGGEPQPLTTHQTARVNVNGNNRRLVVQDQLANGFNKLHAVATTKTITLPGTGQAIAVGQTDPNWRITAIDGTVLSKPLSPVIFDTDSFEIRVRPDLSYLSNNPAKSQWLEPPNFRHVKASLRYELNFDLTEIDPASAQLLLRFIADEHISAIHINGTAIAVPEHGNGPDFTEMTQASIREGLIAGQNTLALTVQRQHAEGTTVFWTGLRAELELTGRRLGAWPNE